MHKHHYELNVCIIFSILVYKSIAANNQMHDTVFASLNKKIPKYFLCMCTCPFEQCLVAPGVQLSVPNVYAYSGAKLLRDLDFHNQCAYASITYIPQYFLCMWTCPFQQHLVALGVQLSVPNVYAFSGAKC